MKSKLFILFYALICVVIVFNEDKQDKDQFSSDVCGYYLYLPAIFIYNDLAHLKFYPAVDSAYNHSLGLQYSLHNIGDRTLNKYPVGVAFFELPLFLVAHTYAHMGTRYRDDGFSLPFQLAGIFSNIGWVIAALLLLRRFLLQYFDDNVTAMTLLFIAFGTNLYAYSSFQVGMSHPYSFFLFCCVLNVAGRLYTPQASRYAGILCGVILGFVFIVRPVNILVAIIPLLWEVDDLASLRLRVYFWRKNFVGLVLMILSFLLLAGLQFSYWHYITGQWFFYSYVGERFDFLHPHLIDGLFSYRKGWILYTPMALVGICGLSFLWKKDRKIAGIVTLFLVLMIYTVFSWQMWWYGGSFGCRPLIESLAVLSLPIGAVSEYFLYNKKRYKKYSYFFVAFLFVALNILQTYQYSMGLLHWDRMTKQYYWKIFGQLDAKRDQNEKYLIKETEENNFGR